MSESRKDLGPDDPAYYAPRRLRDIGSAADRDWRSSTGEPRPHISPPAVHVPQQVPAADFRLSRGGGRAQGHSDAFNDALAKVLREQMEADQAGPGFAQVRRSSFRALASSAIAGVTAALVALTYFVMISPQPGVSGGRMLAALGSGQAVPSVAPARRVSTLLVRNQRGQANELLELGISVTDPEPGATVAIKGLPDDIKLSAEARKSASEWRVRAEDVSDVKVIPPTDFAGDVNLSIELRASNGAMLVTSDQQLSWKPPQTATEVVVLSSAAAPAIVAAQPQPAPIAPMQQQPAPAVPARPTTVVASTAPTVEDAPPPARPAGEPRELSANEIAVSIRRAQELMASGDVKAARALLLRAAEAHDARAALALAKTFDPAATRQSSPADRTGPDPTQARNWYQKAREWGAPEAQRMLDALASYPR